MAKRRNLRKETDAAIAAGLEITEKQIKKKSVK